jgi:hypothetical protein
LRRRNWLYTERRQTIDGRIKGILADGIIGRLNAGAVGDVAYLGDDILVTVQDRMIAAIGPRQFGLFLRADTADHRRSHVFGPLTEDQANTAGGGIDQYRVAGLNGISAVAKIMRRQALQHHCRRRLVIDGVGDFD